MSTLGVLLVLGLSSRQMVVRRRRQPTAETLLVNFALGITAMLLITPVVWDFYLVHLLVPLLVLARYTSAQPRLRLALLFACLLLVLQRYWRWALLFVQSPWLMLFGFLAVLLLWVLLVRLPIATQDQG